MINQKNQIWLDSNCIPIHRSDLIKGVRTLGDFAFLFCTETKDDMNSWVNALDTFYKCQENASPGQVFAPGTKSFLIRKNLETDADLEMRRAKLMLDQEHELEIVAKAEQEKQKKQLEAMTQKIIEEYRQHKELEIKKKEQLRTERKAIIEKNKRLGIQARCIENALEAKAFAEQISLEHIIGEEQSLREKHIMDSAYAKMKNEWMQDVERVTAQENDLKKAQLDIQEKMKKELITETEDWIKNLDPSECYDKKLASGNLNEMKKVCANTVDFGAVPDMKKLLNCLNKSGFCEECCSYYIGVANPANKLKCIQRCEEVINSSANGYLVKFAPDYRAGVDVPKNTMIGSLLQATNDMIQPTPSKMKLIKKVN